MSTNNSTIKLPTHERRRRVAALFLRGSTSTRQLAALFNCHHSTIAADLAWLRAQWVEDVIKDPAQHLAQEIQKINEAERYATQKLYELTSRTLTRTLRHPDGTVETITEPMRDAEAEIALWDLWVKCIKERCQLLGLYRLTDVLPPPMPGSSPASPLYIQQLSPEQEGSDYDDLSDRDLVGQLERWLLNQRKENSYDSEE